MTNKLEIGRDLAERLAHVLYMYDAEKTDAAIELDVLIAAPAVERQEPVIIGYTNYRGEYSERMVTPERVLYGSTEWHPEPQWLLSAWDHDKRDMRSFALNDIGFRDRAAGKSDQPDPASIDLACDRAYRNGLQRGFGLGENGHVEQYHKEFAAYHREILTSNKEQPAPAAVDAAKAFAKGFNTLETAGGKYKIVMQFSGHDDAWIAYIELGKLTACLDKVKELNP